MKTIVITGSTDGIGKLAATQLASEGHQVILHGRNPEKLNAVKKEIINTTGNQNILAFNADLSNLNEVNDLAKDISQTSSSIDVLINNAGVFKSNRPTNKEGLDLRFVVNYLAPVVFTNMLMPLLTKGDSRIINLSSAAQAPVSISALCGTETIDSQNSYAQSKLALTMWSFYLAAKHPSITTIAVNPGSLLNTKMVQEAYGQYWNSADKGASILCQLAIKEKHLTDSGKYFDNDKGSFSAAHPDAYNQEKINHLISETNKILKV
ncbi:SDR family NAD(P)-dependent oxidoreductase [Reichenbachiella agariperforans]|uniref:SDR family NAD(P)-dependent oxidoreductase n=1 Tax=Reichenbachiella agariperforans TaxID=156994 RepID=UPI001C0A10FB|nr:SDR family NAD(P)-dependent oxidoreductase [Reichenbachiella agariperforans]MBU2914250.1 SDR family NAD(P)-dependent oxidoreductase [Reichenbachiella agariperforans]